MKNEKIVTILATFLLAIFVYLGIISVEKISNIMNDPDHDRDKLKNEKKELKCQKFEVGACATEELESNLFLFFTFYYNLK